MKFFADSEGLSAGNTLPEQPRRQIPDSWSEPPSHFRDIGAKRIKEQKNSPDGTVGAVLNELMSTGEKRERK